jgi:ubiquinone/menaquinone biosynthesis C-methylase UbiE
MSAKPKPQTVTEKIHYMEEFIDLDKFLTENHNDPEHIIAYFKENHSRYRHIYNGKGNMHFIVSKDGETFSYDDMFYQPDVAISYAPPGGKVLELGPGQGENLLHLAKSHPDMEFLGLDLFPRELKEKPANLTIQKQDYTSMPDIPDNTYDVVYGVETVVYVNSEKKDKLMAEVYRVLKPGGHFLIWDYVTKYPFETYSREIQTALSVTEHGGAFARIEDEEAWKAHFSRAGFKTVAINSLTDRILPDLKRMQKHFDMVMAHPLRARIIFRTLPRAYTVNLIAGWIAYDSAREHLGNYNEWIMQK